MRRLVRLAAGSILVVVLGGLVGASDLPRASADAAATTEASTSVRLGFVRDYSIYTVNRDGNETALVLKARPPKVTPGNPPVVTTGPDNVLYLQPAWSPDGTRLAVQAATFESHEFDHIWVFDRNMKHVATFDGDSGGDSPSWSPDGRQLVFGDVVTGGWIYLARLPNSVHALLNHFGAPPYDWGPSWSPRGDAVAFSRSLAAFHIDKSAWLYVVRPNGKGLHRLLNQVAVNAAWSPDGKSIAFDDHHRIGVIGADGKGLHYPIPNGTYPAWSPDGTTIAYQRGKDIWLYRLADHGSHLLVRNASDPAWLKPR